MIFENEIKYIKNKDARRMAKEIVLSIEKDMYGPSSKSGRYHPSDEFCNEGLIMHSRRVCFWAVELCREHNFGDDTRDAMLIAAMIHDVGRNVGDYRKHGVKSWNTVLKRVDLKKYTNIRLILSKIKKFSSSHMHHWDKSAPQPKTIDDYIFATADYCAALSNIMTPFLDIVVE